LDAPGELSQVSPGTQLTLQGNKMDDDIQKPLFEVMTNVITEQVDIDDSGCIDQSTISVEDQLIADELETGISGFVNQ
jgi:hypothetical protein